MIERLTLSIMSEKHKCEREKKLNMDSCRHLSDLLLLTSPEPSRTEHDRCGKKSAVPLLKYHARLWNSYHLYLSLISLTILSDSMLLEDKQQFKFGVVMTGNSMVFLVLLLVVKWPRQAQIRRKTYKSRKKHQDRVQDAKRQEKAQKVKKLSIPSQHGGSHRATMGAACWPRKQKK